MVAETRGELAGFAIAQRQLKDGVRGGHIVTIDVASAFRRRGVGRLLMEEMERRLREEGGQWIRLEAAVDNAAALAFYKSLGFAALGQIRDYYYEGLDGVVLEKRSEIPA